MINLYTTHLAALRQGGFLCQDGIKALIRSRAWAPFSASSVMIPRLESVSIVRFIVSLPASALKSIM
jgi:hypothetical protein